MQFNGSLPLHIVEKSAWAIRHGVKNTLPVEYYSNAENTIKNIWDKIPDYFGANINSFFRNELVNKKVGGAPFSDHRLARAIDIDCGNKNREFFNWCKEKLDFDQLIWEYGTKECPAWVHVSYRSAETNRKQIIYKYSK